MKMAEEEGTKEELETRKKDFNSNYQKVFEMTVAIEKGDDDVVLAALKDPELKSILPIDDFLFQAVRSGRSALSVELLK